MSNLDLKRIIQDEAAASVIRLQNRVTQLESDESILDNYAGSAAPTVNDDLDLGYSVGSLWYDLTNGNVYTCFDATDGAAVWKRINVDVGDGARVYHDSSQTLVTGTITSLSFNSERYDDSAFHDTAVNNDRLTIPAGAAGRYSFGGSVGYGINSSGSRGLYIYLNNATVIGQDLRLAAGTGLSTYINLSGEYDFSGGDYIQLRGYQTSGGNLSVLSAGNRSPEFWISRIR